jgi:Fic-DOC domain mobile mystery protein B
MTGSEHGKTSLSADELADLIPSLATKEELNEWERENILLARQWGMADRSSCLFVASDDYIRKLHHKMFDQTWKWAGQYRRSDRNLGVPFQQVRESIAALCGDVRFWFENKTFSVDEAAVRFHYRLVTIHPFPNGNGRHGRMIADILALKLGRPTLTWGSDRLVLPGEARARYLQALHAADAGDLRPLLDFARS